MTRIAELNDDPAVHGIVVQIPFDSANNLNPTNFIYHVLPEKDVDGLHYINAGKLLYGNQQGDAFIPCAARACHELIKATGYSVVGKHVVIVGASLLVGSPLANILKNENATVTLCQNKTQNLQRICKSADILVVAIGNPKFITRDFVKDGAILIDVGINYGLLQIFFFIQLRCFIYFHFT
jgi:5,10-methylene-tetrahydrofolate dehydrogenase/methenyl tetrahydrofolate cyclohydrolase